MTTPYYNVVDNVMILTTCHVVENVAISLLCHIVCVCMVRYDMCKFSYDNSAQTFGAQRL